MMINFVLALLCVVVLGHCIDTGKPQCPSNEEYKTCGTACPKTCKYPRPNFCEALCVKGCFCREGLVRNEINGKCVPLNECDGCPEDEEYRDCGSACVPTCAVRVPDPPCKECVKGCFCKEGLVREYLDGQCITTKECDEYYGF